jgi:cytochrome b subunit of formate dehydrogenase
MSSGENDSPTEKKTDKYERYARARKWTQLFAFSGITTGVFGLFALSLSFWIATAGLKSDIESSEEKSVDLPNFWSGWVWASLVIAFVQWVQIVIDVSYISRWEYELHKMFNNKEKDSRQKQHERSIKNWLMFFGILHLIFALFHAVNFVGTGLVLKSGAKDAAVGFFSGTVFFAVMLFAASIVIGGKNFLAVKYFRSKVKTPGVGSTNTRPETSASAHPALYVAGKMQ